MPVQRTSSLLASLCLLGAAAGCAPSESSAAANTPAAVAEDGEPQGQSEVRLPSSRLLRRLLPAALPDTVAVSFDSKERPDRGFAQATGWYSFQADQWKIELSYYGRPSSNHGRRQFLRPTDQTLDGLPARIESETLAGFTSHTIWVQLTGEFYVYATGSSRLAELESTVRDLDLPELARLATDGELFVRDEHDANAALILEERALLELLPASFGGLLPSGQSCQAYLGQSPPLAMASRGYQTHQVRLLDYGSPAAAGGGPGDPAGLGQLERLRDDPSSTFEEGTLEFEGGTGRTLIVHTPDARWLGATLRLGRFELEVFGPFQAIPPPPADDLPAYLQEANRRIVEDCGSPTFESIEDQWQGCVDVLRAIDERVRA